MKQQGRRNEKPGGRLACDDARRLIDERLDAGRPTAAGGALDEHLAACGGCRALCDELAEVQASLRSLPALRLEDDDLTQIWRRTTDLAPPRRLGRPWARRALRLAPVAASIAMAVAALIILDGPLGRDSRPPGPRGATASDAELERAAEDVRLVLGVTGEALGRSREALMRDVLGDELGPALRHVPLVGPRPRPAGAQDS